MQYPNAIPAKTVIPPRAQAMAEPGLMGSLSSMVTLSFFLSFLLKCAVSKRIQLMTPRPRLVATVIVEERINRLFACFRFVASRNVGFSLTSRIVRD
jgi:hypothetical protein